MKVAVALSELGARARDVFELRRDLRVCSSRACARGSRTLATWLVMISAGVLGIAGCASDPKDGYSWGSSYDRNVRTVSVPIFANTTFSRGLEAELTDAIIKQIQAQTPWRVAPVGEAQTELSGSIVESRLRQLSTNRDTGLAQELSVELTVDFSWRDKRSGKVLLSRKSFTASESFVASRPVGEPIETGEHAAVQRLARDIVSELRSNW